MNLRWLGGLRFTYDLNKLFFSAISEQGSLKTTFFMVDLLNPVKLYTIYQTSGAYKISYIAYDNDYPKWMKICSINDGLTDYCYSDTVNFP